MKDYPSIEMLLESEKEEYNYQRMRLQNIESKVEMIIAIVGSVISFEIANAAEVLKIEYAVNSIENLWKFAKDMMCNFPYAASLVLLMLSVFRLIKVLINLKYKMVDVVKLYNQKIYMKSTEEIVPYLTAIYTKCNAFNLKRLNSYYKKINSVVVLTLISLVLFGIANII